ncbi:C40 family peptidase [Hymenobacter chitinivorans]|uniref:Lipoprotein Spr/probable lipoprotein NlpC n=1 Tax=Hymenobacter chitinivorans DSM 11115 TaxID=1121954 RepID=A0A2M9ASI9_9BACT|nr:C40 family peptidase [Hymenobacter chitinivorans]PJJ48670.1 lipoprotein Spr/probable lipoprotein NlpC [Hymenobacter chitinivorans DSM 11115]
MKNSILYCLAAASLALSFFFEYAPESSNTSGTAAIVATASLLPDFSGDNGDENHSVVTSRDSLAYSYYSQTLGLKLTYNEDQNLLRTVTDWIGTPYRYGSNSKSGTDCSGFVTRVFKEVYGITLQRSSRSMFEKVKRVGKDEMQSGDLVFFRRGPGQPIYHVGIYLQDGKFAHSATNGGVMISSLNQAYYHRNFYAAGRVDLN